MHINVRDILVESVGYNRTYKISDERPELESVRLTQNVEGEITISRLDTNLLVQGYISTEIELDCHRCLRTFSRPIQGNFRQLYAEDPGEEESPIIDGAIDLAPLVEEEIILALPIKILCQTDCKGIENASDKYTKEDTGTRLQTQARITKGTKHGRT